MKTLVGAAKPPEERPTWVVLDANTAGVRGEPAYRYRQRPSTARDARYLAWQAINDDNPDVWPW
ncbi:MAG TPA: hypothetical protein VJT31_07100 [Rugosimonospora sp.]|nr:hypothetical protein [Rugosimonospora sp.]